MPTFYRFTCPTCSLPFASRVKAAKYCCRECFWKAHSGEGHSGWKGGRHHNTEGYVRQLVRTRKYELEHRVLAESALGRSLPPKAVVHHWDDNPANNTPSNLVICQDDAYHLLLHARKRRFDDTGSLDLKRCCVCKVPKPLDEFYKCASAWDKRQERCKICDNATRDERPRYAVRL